MKINEVCKQTDLTERTIRFYIEKGLLKTNSQTVNGRTTLDFTDNDIDVLKDISKLRKAGFSIADILDMQRGDQEVQNIVQKHYENLQNEFELREYLLNDLEEIKNRGQISWRKLASLLFTNRTSNLPDIICYPLDDDECQNVDPSPKRNWLGRIAKWCVCFLIIASMIGALLYIYRKPPSYLTTVFVVGEVIVEKKWREDDGQKYLSICSVSPYTGFEQCFKYPRTVKIDSDDIYDTILLNSEPYTSFCLVIDVPSNDAYLSDLLDAYDLLDVDQELIVQKILQDQTLISKYCTVKQIHAM